MPITKSIASAVMTMTAGIMRSTPGPPAMHMMRMMTPSSNAKS